MRRRWSLAPTLADRLEDRLAPSHFGVHSSVQVRHDHAVQGGHHQEKSQGAVSSVALNGTIEGHSL